MLSLIKALGCVIVSVCFFSSAFAQGVKITPEQAYKKLLDGNKRYVDDKPLHPNQSAERRENTTNKQDPFAIIVGCSDSRVPPEIVFDQGLGDLFVVRVAGNIAGPVEMDSIDYSADILHTPLIMVMGHENCGAVNAVLTNPNGKDIADIVPYIQPAVEKSKNMPGNRLANAIKENVKLVMASLNANPVLANLVKKNQLKIVGGYYNLEDGSVTSVP